MMLPLRLKKLWEKSISKSYLEGYMYCFGLLAGIFVYKAVKRNQYTAVGPKIPEQSFKRYVQMQKEAGREI